MNIAEAGHAHCQRWDGVWELTQPQFYRFIRLAEVNRLNNGVAPSIRLQLDPVRDDVSPLGMCVIVG
jgi:hypothetical protein